MASESTFRTDLTPEQLIEQKWFQVSKKRRLLAQLPPGKTGKEALIDYMVSGIRASLISDREKEKAERNLRAWAEVITEDDAGDKYLREYAQDLIEVSALTFERWRNLGGRDYLSACKNKQTQSAA